jgi:hypothetical protein
LFDQFSFEEGLRIGRIGLIEKLHGHGG